MTRQNEYDNAIEWCCNELKEQTSMAVGAGRWEARAIEVDRDGTLYLLQVQAYGRGDVGVRQISFGYCPFCGAAISDTSDD